MKSSGFARQVFQSLGEILRKQRSKWLCEFGTHDFGHAIEWFQE